MELMHVVKGESIHVETKVPSSQTVVSAVRKNCCKGQESRQKSGDLGDVCHGGSGRFNFYLSNEEGSAMGKHNAKNIPDIRRNNGNGRVLKAGYIHRTEHQKS